MFFQLMESNKKGYGIMAFGAGEAEQQRDIRMQHRIVAGKLEQSITKVKGIKVAVPSPGSIRSGRQGRGQISNVLTMK